MKIAHVRACVRACVREHRLYGSAMSALRVLRRAQPDHGRATPPTRHRCRPNGSGTVRDRPLPGSTPNVESRMQIFSVLICVLTFSGYFLCLTVMKLCFVLQSRWLFADFCLRNGCRGCSWLGSPRRAIMVFMLLENRLPTGSDGVPQSTPSVFLYRSLITSEFMCLPLNS